MKDDQITIKPNTKEGQKEATEGITLMDKTKEANERKHVNPMDIQMEHK